VEQGVWYGVTAINTWRKDSFYVLFVLERALYPVGGAEILVRGDSHQHMEQWLFLSTLCSRKGTSSSGWSRESGTVSMYSFFQEGHFIQWVEQEVTAINTWSTDCFYVLFFPERALHPVGGAGSDSHQHMEH
jgi:hypothetical protein